jgi:large subunit ribosomal protein L22
LLQQEISADTLSRKIKEKDKNMEAVAKLKNVPTSPRKMRLVADLVRGSRVSDALNVLRFEAKEGAARVEKLLLSAVANWQEKNTDSSIEDSDLYIKEIYVDGGRILKRLRPAPQGRAHRIRKRSNHVTVIIDSFNETVEEVEIEETASDN